MKFEDASVLITVLDYPFIENECVGSTFALYEYSKYMCPGTKIPRNNISFVLADGTSPSRAHNHAIQCFMSWPEYKSLLIIGRDHIFKLNALKILFEADKDIIGGITSERQRALEQIGEERKSIVHDWVKGGTRALSRKECLEKMNQSKGEPFEVPSMGDGLMLFKRKVFEKIDPPWFYEPPMPLDRVPDGHGRGALGCDIAFFEKARKEGFKVWAHPAVQYVHIGRGYTAVAYDVDKSNFAETD